MFCLFVFVVVVVFFPYLFYIISNFRTLSSVTDGQTDGGSGQNQYARYYFFEVGGIKNWPISNLATVTNGLRQANLILIAYASSEGSGEPAHPRSFDRTSAARSYKH